MSEEAEAMTEKVPELIPAHKAALAKVAAGKIHALTIRGVAPTPVRALGRGATTGADISGKAWNFFREHKLITWEQGEGPGPWLVTLTHEGHVANGTVFARDRWPDTPKSELSIIGRERSLIDGLTKMLRNSVRGHNISPISEQRRGSSFEVQFVVDGEITGHIARVTVELDRFERK
ncbi:hypothetical protein [Candidatus Solirubrobacter pratensis]|uniref:hypothetical protein n=1 Tax=Candidatus Solirubrobacter pratensis TaxID=1298857 RepID=UPI00048677F0|nr:hypothetical protein [Candidatus Solirubrobacter pratensis]